MNEQIGASKSLVVVVMVMVMLMVMVVIWQQQRNQAYQPSAKQTLANCINRQTTRRTAAAADDDDDASAFKVSHSNCGYIAPTADGQLLLLLMLGQQSVNNVKVKVQCLLKLERENS